MEIKVAQIRPAGYAYLLEKFQLTTMPLWHSSSVTTTGIHRSKLQGGGIEDIYPLKIQKTPDHQ